MKFEKVVQNYMPNLKISKLGVMGGNKMVAAAILAKPSKGYNSVIYEPILMKVEIEVLNSWHGQHKNLKTGNAGRKQDGRPILTKPSKKTIG